MQNSMEDFKKEVRELVEAKNWQQATDKLWPYVKEGKIEELKLKSEAIKSLGNYANQIMQEDGDLNYISELLNYAVQYDPTNAYVLNNLANCYRKLHDYRNAYRNYAMAIGMDPDYANAYGNYAQFLHWFGKYEEEERLLKHAMSLNPDLPLLHWNYGILLKLLGNYELGYKESEWRFKYPPFAYPLKASGKFEEKYWNLKRLTKKTRLIIFCEQGFGDAIQYFRFLKLLREKTPAHIIFSTRKQLHSLFDINNKDNELYDEIIDYVIPKDFEYDVHYPLYSLPIIFKTTVDTVPFSDKSLFVDDKHLDKWKSLLKSKGKNKFKVGFCCSGRDINPTARFRTIEFEQFKSLFEQHEDVDWYNLQIEDNSDFKNFKNVYEFNNEIKDFADTAALIENLDLVISIETSVAHLAGALGKAVWILLAKYPAWRWLLEREDSPWYQSAKLFRQKEQFEWSDVLASISESLQGAKHE